MENHAKLAPADFFITLSLSRTWKTHIRTKERLNQVFGWNWEGNNGRERGALKSMLLRKWTVQLCQAISRSTRK
jgi:hypothetical protein